MQASDEIKQKLDIVDVIRDYISVLPAGANFKAKCPFHNEKTPSLMISPDKQIWHCFGCGKGGDIFEFVKEMEGVEFVEALKILAPKAGVVLKRQDPKKTSERNRLLDILEWSRKFYHQGLLKSPKAEAARAYLYGRGLKDETIEEWQIGYSPEGWEVLSGFLRSKGFKDNELLKSGMAAQSQKGRGCYDRFRDRIMFPINDLSSHTVAFSARVNPAKEASETMGKYINSPQTPIYDKSRIIFGLDKAKRAIREKDEVILVEGQMDVISAHQAGYRNVVAASGTALTADQVALLKRYTQNISMAFDMDAAGRMAADRGIREALRADMRIRVISIPSGKDPDECIRQAPEVWEQAVAQAKPVMRHYLDEAVNKYDLRQAEGKRLIARDALNWLARLEDRIEQDHYLKELAGILDVDEQILRETLAKARRESPPAPSRPSAPQATVLPRPKDGGESTSEMVLALAFKFPAQIEYLIRNLEVAELAGDLNKELYRKMVMYYNKRTDENDEKGDEWRTNFDYKDFNKWLQAEAADFGANADKTGSAIKDLDQQNHFNRLVFLADYGQYRVETTDIRKELVQLVRSLKRRYLSGRMKEVERMIADLENQDRPEEAAELMGELKMLSEDIIALE